MEMNANNIVKHIIENFPSCCLEYNCKNNSCNEVEMLNECRDFFRDKIGICGCGNPDSVENKISKLLTIIDQFSQAKNYDQAYKQKEQSLIENFGVDSICSNDLLLFMVYVLNDKKILEHGSSIEGSWLTDFGKMYLYILNCID